MIVCWHITPGADGEMRDGVKLNGGSFGWVEERRVGRRVVSHYKKQDRYIK